MKRILLALLAACLLSSPAAFAQEGQETTLDNSEKCNNWARRFCTPGNHEAAVNDSLLKQKKMGVKITEQQIRAVANKFGPRSPAPAPK